MLVPIENKNLLDARPKPVDESACKNQKAAIVDEDDSARQIAILSDAFALQELRNRIKRSKEMLSLQEIQAIDFRAQALAQALPYDCKQLIARRFVIQQKKRMNTERGFASRMFNMVMAQSAKQYTSRL